jgi:hypothetical protein
MEGLFAKSYTVYSETVMHTSTMPIDTQRVVDKLTERGVPVDQAKAYAFVLGDALQTHDAQINARCCTKDDLSDAVRPITASIVELQGTVRELYTKIDMVEIKLRAEIKEATAKARSDVITWIISASILQTAFNTALILKIVE